MTIISVSTTIIIIIIIFIIIIIYREAIYCISNMCMCMCCLCKCPQLLFLIYLFFTDTKTETTESNRNVGNITVTKESKPAEYNVNTDMERRSSSKLFTHDSKLLTLPNTQVKSVE